MHTDPSADGSFTGWLRENAIPLAHLEPDAPLDDLEPLKGMIGSARVVAVGESCHFIREFWWMRERILRYLVERCGFFLFGFESGFSEGWAVDAWARGSGPANDLDRLVAEMLPLGFSAPLRWLRQHNADARSVVRFAGVDLPAAGGSLLPALEPLTDYLRNVDPEAMPRLEKAVRIATKFAGHSMAVAAPAWARLDSVEQDALSSTLVRLLTRFRAMEPLYVSRSDQSDYDIGLRRLEAACHADYHFSAMADLFAGRGLVADTSAREIYMAESIRWHLDHAGSSSRMVLAAHNAHIQKTPILYDGQVSAIPMGQHARRALGDGYFAIALTSGRGQTARMQVDEKARFGFTVQTEALQSPERGSIEAAFSDAGLALSIAGLRGAPRDLHAPDRIQMQGDYSHTPILDSFDAVIHVPKSTVIEGLI